jgi:ABC-2 family transporter
MKALLRYYLGYAAAFLAFLLIYLFVFQYAALDRSDQAAHDRSYGQAELFFGFVAGVLAVAFVEGERQDRRLEYLWSLPIRPAQIFMAKFALCIGVLVSVIVLHMALEVSQALWWLARTRRPYEPHLDGLRFHPFLFPTLWLPLGIWIGLSEAGRRVPRRVLIPIVFTVTMVGPWLVLTTFYRSLLPAEAPDLFFRLSYASFLDRYNATYLTRGTSFWLFWVLYFAAACGAGLLLTVRALKFYAGREISPEIEEEE